MIPNILIRYFSSILFFTIKYIEKRDITKKTTILCMFHPANAMAIKHIRLITHLLNASIILLLFFPEFCHSSSHIYVYNSDKTQ